MSSGNPKYSQQRPGRAPSVSVLLEGVRPAASEASGTRMGSDGPTGERTFLESTTIPVSKPPAHGALKGAVRAEAIRLVLEEGLRPSEAAERIGLSSLDYRRVASIVEWEKRVRQGNAMTPTKKTTPTAHAAKFPERSLASEDVQLLANLEQLARLAEIVACQMSLRCATVRRLETEALLFGATLNHLRPSTIDEAMAGRPLATGAIGLFVAALHRDILRASEPAPMSEVWP